MKHIFAFFLGLALIPATAQAVTLSDLILFPTPTAITDKASGNQINFTFEHSFPELSTSGLSLVSGALSLTHFGNSNSEPTAEAWSLFSESGVFIGKLSGSNSVKITDSWELSGDVLNEMKTKSFWNLNVGVSEITPFNNEKIELYESKLRINYDQIPNAVEPSSFFLLISGILMLMSGRPSVRQT